jgi:hypothetical protein
MFNMGGLNLSQHPVEHGQETVYPIGVNPGGIMQQRQSIKSPVQQTVSIY